MDKLHEHTLSLAEELLTGEAYGGAAYRRAISSAYYALFQRLSSLCASRLAGGDVISDEYRRLYRALDHKQVRAALNKSLFKAGLGDRFEQLQDARHWADYSVAPHPDLVLEQDLSAGEARFYIEKAREALQFVDSLDPPAQLKLAVLLIVRER